MRRPLLAHSALQPERPGFESGPWHLLCVLGTPHCPYTAGRGDTLCCLPGCLRGPAELGARCVAGAQETGSTYTVVVGAQLVPVLPSQPWCPPRGHSGRFQPAESCRTHGTASRALSLKAVPPLFPALAFRPAVPGPALPRTVNPGKAKALVLLPPPPPASTAASWPVLPSAPAISSGPLYCWAASSWSLPCCGPPASYCELSEDNVRPRE